MNTRQSRRDDSACLTLKVKLQEENGDWEDMMSLAEFEIERDPYRGLIHVDVASPWFECRYTEQDHGKVSEVAGCACPSLISWTNEQDARIGRKKRKRLLDANRKLLGRRCRETTFQCPCDHNPFCLATLGGVMDDFLAEAAEEVFHSDSSVEVIIAPPIIDLDDSSDSSPGLEIIDVDHNEHSQLKTGKASFVDLEECGVQSVGYKSPSVATKSSTAVEGSQPNYPIDSSITAPAILLEDVNFEPNEVDHNDPSCIYSQVTKEQLSSIRRVVHIDLDLIRAYVESIFLAHPDATLTPNKYMDRVRELHIRMLFRNPSINNTTTQDGKVRFAIPPGMKNLGATCYLNTQLQCLARNTAFLDGIVTWKASKRESRMDSVLSTLQQIMARLTYGVKATCSTKDFAYALGLQNDEMQDPNEFARLLFQRMHEAFQQSSLSGDLDSPLATLLPSLFEGDMTYQTQCNSCGRTTERREKFMDINLPIIHSIPLDKKDIGQLQIRDAFSVSKKSDRQTSVQSCLDQYMCAEELAGDNQYWCEGCATKRDATRHLVLTKLPPVLNLQLCRYVFDRKSLTKKKLADKVSLPRYLNVKSAQDPDSTKYRLCAVMKHLGSSAYQGHYIAEAMDWQTGLWFEFNDENIRILESGPSCCDAELLTSKRKSKGSQDAYNIYYVKESFLAKCAVNSIVYQERRESEAIVRKLESERRVTYDMLSDMCRNDAEVADRGRRLRRGILTLLKRHFLSSSNCVRFGAASQADVIKDCVWVDGAGLRCIFSCSSLRDADLWNMLLRKDLLCNHNVGLEPRVARCGKVIPTTFFNELVELLRVEVCRPVTLPTSLSQNCSTLRISCGICSNAYTTALRKNVEWVRSLRLAFQGLDPRIENTLVEAENDEFVYAVPKRFVTAFRKSISDFLKKIESLDSISSGVETLEYLFIKSLAAASNDDFDATVNSSILCCNKKCCPINKRHVRHISEHLWRSIEAIFPGAIQVQIPKGRESVWLMCSECEESTKESSSFEELASLVTSGLSQETLKGRRKPENLLLRENLPDSCEFHLVHKQDLERLWESCKLLKSRSTSALSSVKHKLVEVLFSNACNSDDKGDPHETVLRKWAPTPLFCSAHNLVLNPAVVVLSQPGSSESSRIWRFHDDVDVLSATEYRHFLRLVIRLHNLLFPMSSSSRLSLCDGNSEIDLDVMCASLSSSSHPQFRLQRDTGHLGDSCSFLTCFIGNTAVEMCLTPAMCADQSCNHDCIESLKGRERLRRRHICDQNVGISNVLNSDGVIDVDDEIELIGETTPSESDNMKFCLKILDVEAAANLEEVIASLGQLDSRETGSRRSTRKRKQRYHLGSIKGEELLNLRRGHNIAAVRLLLFERLACFKIDQELILLLNLNSCDVECKHLKIEIDSNWDSRTIAEVVADAAQSLQISESNFDALFDSMILVVPTTDKLPKRKMRNGDEDQTETLLESLLQIANLADRNKLKDDKKESIRRLERGFTGTFLQASPSPLVGTINASSSGDVDDANKAGISDVRINREITISQFDIKSQASDGQRDPQTPSSLEVIENGKTCSIYQKGTNAKMAFLSNSVSE